MNVDFFFFDDGVVARRCGEQTKINADGRMAETREESDPTEGKNSTDLGDNAADTAAGRIGLFLAAGCISFGNF
jgi:hypothetical protein